MIQSVKAHAKRVLASAAPFVAVLTAVALTDLLLQREVRTQLEMFFEDPFLSGLFRFGRALKWGLLLSAPAFLLGRCARPFYLVLWPYLVLVETVEAVARISYGMVLDGDWLMIVYTSSLQEMREFFGQFSWVGVAATVLALSVAVYAQDARQRTVQTIVADVLAAMPAQNSSDFATQMGDLASAAPQSIVEVAKLMKPAGEYTPAPHDIPEEKLEENCYEDGRLLPPSSATKMKGFHLVEDWVPSDGAGTRKQYIHVLFLIRNVLLNFLSLL